MEIKQGRADSFGCFVIMTSIATYSQSNPESRNLNGGFGYQRDIARPGRQGQNAGQGHHA